MAERTVVWPGVSVVPKNDRASTTQIVESNGKEPRPLECKDSGREMSPVRYRKRVAQRND